MLQTTTRPPQRVPTLGDMRMPHDPAQRGNHVIYREHEVNHCPGCGRTHWHIGRVSAECAFCATVLSLDASHSRSAASPIHVRRGKGGGSVK